MRKYFKIIICSALTAFSLFTLASCNSDSAFRDQNISFHTSQSVSTLDPQMATTDAELTVIKNCFEGLVTTDADGKITEGAAEKYSVSDDGLKYIFTLRKDLFWSDGETKIEPEDYIYGVTRALTLKSPSASTLFSIKNARAVFDGGSPPDELGIVLLENDRIEITLESPDEYFLNILATAVAMPCNKDFFISTKGKYGLGEDYIMTNGAFMLNSWDPDNKLIKCSRFGYYSGANPAIPASFTIGFGREDKVIDTSLSQLELDSAQLSGEYAAELKDFRRESFYTKNYVLYISPQIRTESGTALNKALINDIDKSSVDVNLTAAGKPSHSLIPAADRTAAQLYCDKASAVTLPAYDASFAKSCLDDNSLTALSGLSIYYPEGSSELELVSGIIAQTWQKDLSAYVNKVAVSEKSIFDKALSGEYKIAIIPVFSITNEAYYSIGSLASLSPSLAEQYRNTRNTVKSIHALERSLIKSNCFYPIMQKSSDFCISKNINKMNITENHAVDFRYAEKTVK